MKFVILNDHVNLELIQQPTSNLLKNVSGILKSVSFVVEYFHPPTFNLMISHLEVGDSRFDVGVDSNLVSINSNPISSSSSI
jgi:hypothetical protein